MQLAFRVFPLPWMRQIPSPPQSVQSYAILPQGSGQRFGGLAFFLALPTSLLVGCVRKCFMSWPLLLKTFSQKLQGCCHEVCD
jgi:hypothetical protein